LQRGERLFCRSYGPTIVRAEVLYSLRALLVVERANVAEFDDLGVALFEPAQREPLGAAHVWALGVDAAGALWAEEGALTFRVRPLVQDGGRLATNSLGLDLEDRETVSAAVVAAEAAAQALCVAGRQGPGAPIDLLVQGSHALVCSCTHSGALVLMT